jgi:hypothetical protein
LRARPGASGSLVILSSSGETGWNPTPAFACCNADMQIARPTTTHLIERNIDMVISP